MSAKTIDLDLIKMTTDQCKATMRKPAEVAMVANAELLMDALAESRGALEAARHELTTLHGLTAHDGPGDGWTLDLTAVIATIDTVLPPAMTQ